MEINDDREKDKEEAMKLLVTIALSVIAVIFICAVLMTGKSYTEDETQTTVAQTEEYDAGWTYGEKEQ